MSAILQVARGCLILRPLVSSRKAARRPGVQGSGFRTLCPFYILCRGGTTGPTPGTRRMDEWLVSGPTLGTEKENVFHKNANLAGLDSQGLCDPILLRRLRLEDHRFKAYVGFRVN